MDIHQKRIFVIRKSFFSRTSPELITRWIILIPKAFWRSRVPPGLYLRIFHFGRGNPVVHLNFRADELDISSHSRTFPELITQWIFLIPKAFWRSWVPVGLFSRVSHFGLGNLVVHLNFRVSELDISSHSRPFSELITRPIILIPTAFWRSRAPPGLFSMVLHLGVGNPLVHFIFDGKGVQSFWLSLVLWFIFDDSQPNKQRDSEMHFGF